MILKVKGLSKNIAGQNITKNSNQYSEHLHLKINLKSDEKGIAKNGKYGKYEKLLTCGV